MAHLYSPSSPIHWSWVNLAGPDAKDFLHRLTTVNVRNLAPGEGARGCFLTAQGKIRAYFTLWNYGPDEYGFEFDAGASNHWKTELLAAIDQFHFAEKFQLTDVTAMQSLWIFGAQSEMGAMKTEAVEGGLRVCHHGDQDFGRSWITLWGEPAKLAGYAGKLGATQPADHEMIERWRVETLRPWVDSEIDSSTIPLEVGLRDAVAENKGCYPGQEVIERIISLGSPARRLAQFTGTGPAPKAGDAALNEANAEIGKITSVVSAGESFTALGFVKKIFAKEGAEARLGNTTVKISRIAPYA